MRYKGIKGRAWNAVRKAIRKRDGKNCYTCHRKGSEWSYDTGHYMPVAIVGSNNKLSWHPQFIHVQCKYCNGMGQGMQTEYRKHLIKDYGKKTVQWFEDNYRKTNPVKNWNDVIALFDGL